MNEIEKALKEHILDKNIAFVFNTDVAVSSWTDFIVRQDGKDCWPPSVAQERFLAWDAFKGQALKSTKEGSESIPSLLRKLFARGLLERVRGGEAFFERLINSDYKENALSFTDWISGVLPSLGRWRALAQKFIQEKDGAEFLLGERNNAENRDYLKLYNEYARFLRERNLFEPAWQDARFDFASKKNYVVFFPELLDDFDEYKDVLEEAEQKGRVRLVRLPQDEREIRADYWTSVRLELRMAALRILRANKEGTDWNDIALCVPDIENLRPYAERELELYQIPFVTRSGIKLGKTEAGRVFRKIQDCAQGAFSYQSVRALVLDQNIPWKNPGYMETLVRLGKESKCLARYTDSDGREVDPWLLDLQEGIKKEGADEFLAAQKFYKRLKESVQAISDAKNFRSIKKAWTDFEKEFILPAEEIPERANNILSRCVKTMDELILLEKKFPEIAKGKIECYSFFLNEIESAQYQERKERRGVSVFDYKLSAEAAIKKQFVINASQEKIAVQKAPLSFLSKNERRFLLGDAEADRSALYAKAYALCSDCVFSASQAALGAFAIPHSALAANEKPREADADLEKDDFIKAEKEFLMGRASPPPCLTEAQKKSFERYFLRNGEREFIDALRQNEPKKEFLASAIERKAMSGRARGADDGQTVHVTPSDLKDFFPCPQKWIFKDLLRVNEFSLDTDLFEVYDQGGVNHKLLELYFKSLKDAGEALPISDEATGKLLAGGSSDYEETALLPLLESFAESAFQEAKAYKKSALVQETLKSQKGVFARGLVQFLREFCKKEQFGGWTVLETEWEADANIPPALQGRMDLLLRAPDGEEAIVDYKNSSSSIPKGALNLKRAGELDDYQMAAYVFLREKANPGQKVSRASFVQIKKFNQKKVLDPKPSSRGSEVAREDFDGAIDCLEAAVRSVGESLETKNFPLKKTRRYKDCPECKFNSICRTAY